MDNRVNNGPARIATNNVAANNAALAATRNAAPVNNAAVNTLDATAFSSRPGAPADLAELQAVIAELEDRITLLEARVAELSGEDPAAPANLGGQPGAANAAANNAAPANNIQLPDGVNLPSLDSVLPQANAPAENVALGDVGDDLADAPANNATANEVAAANQTIQDLKPGADAARLKGLEAVEHVLKGAKLTKLTPAEEQIVGRAVKRVHEIGRKIGNGEDPGKYAAELFALKHTLADPAGAGKHASVTLGAQTIAYIEDEKAKLAKAITAAEKKLARKPDPALAREVAVLNARYKSLVGIEKAIDGAKLTGLSPEAEKAAGATIDRLGALAEAVVGGGVDPARIEAEVYKLGQSLKAPGKPEAASPVVNAGADVVARIAQGKSAIHARLRDIDDQIMGGAAPEAYAAERSRLLANAEALEGLGDAVKAARIDQGTSRERREVSFGLAKASAIADAIGRGEDASALRDDIFVLRQTFQEPIASKTNPAIQAGAAALALIGQAEAQNLKAREAIAAGAARGRDMRAKDPQAAALARQAEDLETMRKAIEDTDFGGLTPEQEGRGAQLIDAMRAVSQKVAAGDDYAHHRARYEELAGQLAALRNWHGGAAQAPAPIPTRPAPQPRPAGTDDAPVPAPAPAPADTSPKPGKKYTVQKGDYLTKIAREQLGDPNRFQEIIALNQDKYPSLKTNPDLIYAGWELTLPAGAGKPAKPAEAQAPKPTKPKPKPKPAQAPAPLPPTPASVGISDQDAATWLRRNLDANGRISREKIAEMPKGPGRDALLEHFDALLFGFIDPGRDGWTQLHQGDVERIEKALEVGGSIKGLAGQITRQVLVDRQVGDRNGDFKLDEADVRAYAAELRTGAAPKPAEAKPAPKPADPKPADNGGDAARLRRDLDAYLANPENKDDSDAVLHLLRTAPQYAVAATAEQKGRLIKLALDGSANGDERRAALTILRMADERKETKAVLAAMDRKAVADLLSDLGDEKEGLEAAKLLTKAGAYADEHVWKAMDDDAVSGLVKSLGFKEPMIGTNDELRALPEAAKHHMIKALLGGNLTWGELAQAEWLNQHTEIPYRIPDYRNR